MIAQTNIQLYNQLRGQQRSDRELKMVHRAYRLAVTLYSGYFQADGKPFVAHSVGVASIMAQLKSPGEYVAAALVHNIYGNGDFGDGRRSGVTDKRRRLVRQAVGEQVELLLLRFRNLRITPDTLGDVRERVDRLDATDRRLLLMDLADTLEKYVDDGVLYYGDGSWVTDRTQQYGPSLIEIARKLGAEDLAAMLSQAFARANAERGQIPAVLYADRKQKYLALSVPQSCRRRLWPLLRPKLARTWQELGWKIRPRVRRVGKAIRHAFATDSIAGRGSHQAEISQWAPASKKQP